MRMNWTPTIARKTASSSSGLLCAYGYGDEPVRLAVELHGLDALAAISLERASEIVQRHASDAGDDPVRDFRRQHSRRVVLAALAPAARDVISLIDLREQSGDVVRVV